MFKKIFFALSIITIPLPSLACTSGTFAQRMIEIDQSAAQPIFGSAPYQTPCVLNESGEALVIAGERKQSTTGMQAKPYTWPPQNGVSSALDADLSTSLPNGTYSFAMPGGDLVSVIAPENDSGLHWVSANGQTSTKLDDSRAIMVDQHQNDYYAIIGNFEDTDGSWRWVKISLPQGQQPASITILATLSGQPLTVPYINDKGMLVATESGVYRLGFDGAQSKLADRFWRLSHPLSIREHSDGVFLSFLGLVVQINDQGDLRYFAEK